MPKPAAQFVTPPKPATLKRYGLPLDEWYAILAAQHGGCGVCNRIPSSGRLCIDHEHVRGWKKMPPEERRKYVRGLLCFLCNSRYCSRGMTIERALNMASYLAAYAKKAVT